MVRACACLRAGAAPDLRASRLSNLQYHWVYILTESVWASWTFGWMELLGQIASVSAVAFVWAIFQMGGHLARRD